MLSTETLFEYYHLITLSNVTVLDIPAGRSGFLPAAHPTTYAQQELDQPDQPDQPVAASVWPKMGSLNSPHVKPGEGEDDDFDSRFAPKRPAFVIIAPFPNPRYQF